MELCLVCYCLCFLVTRAASSLHEVRQYSTTDFTFPHQSVIHHDGILALFALKRTPPCACTTLFKME